jgi:tetratricopeptide (TPR) repeat protein
LDEAIQHYERAIQLDPDYANAHFNLGLALAGQGRAAEAEQHFEQALKLAIDQGNTALAGSIRPLLQRPQYP